MFLLHLPTTFPTCLQEIPTSINWVATIKYKILGSNTDDKDRERQKRTDLSLNCNTIEVVSSSEKVTPIKSYKRSLRILTKIQVVVCVHSAGVGSSGVLKCAVQ